MQQQCTVGEFIAAGVWRLAEMARIERHTAGWVSEAQTKVKRKKWRAKDARNHHEAQICGGNYAEDDPGCG